MMNKTRMRRVLPLLAVMAAAVLLACGGVALAQGTHGKAPLKQAGKDRIPNRYIVVLNDDVPDVGQVAEEQVQDEGITIEHTYELVLKGFSAEIPAPKLDEVRSDPRVAFVAEDFQVQAERKKKRHRRRFRLPITTQPTPEAQQLPTGVNRVEADQSSTKAGDGSGTVDADIAILDTGIHSQHPDLNVAGGYNCASDLPNPDRNAYSDNEGHGTHVAGIAAAKDDSVGVVGVAPGARLWAVKVLNDVGTGRGSWLLCGIEWVTANAGTIEVANMSLGGPGSDDGNCGRTNNDPLHSAICNSVAQGVTYTVAAGNDSEDSTSVTPAAYREVIAVSALADYDGQPNGSASPTCRNAGPDDTFASFSAYGSNVDLGAPGVCIFSTYYNPLDSSLYATISGTSQASPHVAGAAALYKLTNPGATPSQVRAALISAGEPLGSGHTDPSGRHPEPVVLVKDF